MNVYIDKRKVEEIVRMALKEDVGPKDVTTSVVVPKELSIKAHIISKAEGVICGLPVCEKVFNVLDENTRFKPQLEEGSVIHEGKAIAYLEGNAAHILTGERVALNFLSHLSGIATKTRSFVNKVGSLSTKILDTRKTTPGMRYLEKYAVSVGGGYNHRTGLWDQVLIKDNHIVIRDLASHGKKLESLIKDTRSKIQKNIKIEIEVDSFKDFEAALRGRPDIVMLDNMTLEDAKKAVKIRNKIGKYPLIEVSGNITLKNVADYAACGVDRISIGSLTHSVNSVDISLEVDAAL